MDDPSVVGPVVSRAFVPKKDGGQRTENVARMLGPLMARTAGALISGRYKDTPFFDDNGDTSKPIQRAAREERAAALMGLNK